jgi:hypothetical protein
VGKADQRLVCALSLLARDALGVIGIHEAEW